MPCFADCTRSAKRKLVVVKESQRCAIFNNSSEISLQLTQFDKCVDCEGSRADFIVTHPDCRRVIVELKGKDILAAGSQIVNTLRYLKSEGLLNGNVAALVVCSRVPLGVSSVQRLTGSLRQAGVHRVKIKSREWSGRFDDLFA